MSLLMCTLSHTPSEKGRWVLSNVGKRCATPHHDQKRPRALHTRNVYANARIPFWTSCGACRSTEAQSSGIERLVRETKERERVSDELLHS